MPKMKRLLVIFSLLFISIACNTKARDTAKVKTTKDILDTTFVKKTDRLNISKDFVLGKFDYRIDSSFVKIDAEYTTKEIYLNKQVVKAFLEMHKSAQEDSIELKIISGTRNFPEQKVIWERKWRKYKNLEPKERAKKILEYSSMPSSSRHHWGTDIDLNSLNNSYFNSGKGLEEYNWLRAHANSYGFYEVYTSMKNGRSGYNPEKWHWSYLPLACQYLDYYNTKIRYEDINGFEGFNLASELNIFQDYVNGISEKAKMFQNN